LEGTPLAPSQAEIYSIVVERVGHVVDRSHPHMVTGIAQKNIKEALGVGRRRVEPSFLQRVFALFNGFFGCRRYHAHRSSTV
jgi:hypothetical protein